MLCCIAPAPASSPNLVVITPRGGQRGTDVTMVFHGERLSDAKDVFFYSAGFTVREFQVLNDTLVKAVVRIAPDCRLGEHAVRLRTATGISEMQNFYVGALPNIDEKEPNNDFAAPQKVPLNVTINGVIQAEDVDYFAFEAKKGQRMTAEVEAMRLGHALCDPYVAILDSKRFELASCDDCPLLGQDAVASVVIPADGTYVVQVRESAYGGNGSCFYRLHLGTFPRPLGTVPAGGRPGEEVAVRFLGDAAGEFAQKIKLPPVVEPRFGLFAQDAGGLAPSPNPFRLSDLPNVVETEPNNTHEQATRCELPAALNGVIAVPGDVDCFRFKAKAGQVFDFNCYARRLGSPLDPVLYVSPAGGPAVVGNDDAFGPDSFIRFTVPKDGEYVLTVVDQLGKGGPNYFYRVEVTPPRPRVTLTIPKFAYLSQERQTMPVPRGNRYATLITATRADCGGPLVLGAENLPKGVTMKAEPMAADVDTIPVVFEAAADAPVAGTLANVTARHADPAQKIPSEFVQSAELILGPPNISIYWKYEADRAAVAVTDEAPFKIRVVEPAVPLVQSGLMSLKVVAERKAGFKAPIALAMLWNPPGVGSGGATIPESATEALIPLSANGAAWVRTWKLVVVGVATVGNGPLWVSSQMFPLEIAPPYVTVAMERAACEQGKGTDIYCKLQARVPFEGKARVDLLGLPNKVTAAPVEITKETKEFAFKVAVDPAAPAGTHKNIFSQVVITQAGAPVVHYQGATELRVDVPLAAKAAAPATQQAAARPAPAAAPAKRLSRLEKLRQEQEEREKAARSAGGGH